MGDYLKKVFGQIADFFKGLSPGRQVALITTGGTIVAAMAMLFLWAGRTSYQSLMTNLNPEDSQNVMRFLREKNIPFKMDDAGRSISIPSEVVDETRLALATQGMPQSSVVGYEVFDKQQLGTTSLVQRLNQKRAREGELMRTIQTIKGVKRSRVHLAIPEKSAFVEDQKKSTASVVLDLEPGILLNEKQIYGIGNLVSRAVEGLDIDDVVIVDSNGKTLSKNAGDSLASANSSQIEFKQKIERDMEARIEGMLSRVVGDGRVVATVSADVDFAQVSETQTIYDQDGSAVRSMEKNSQSMEGTRPNPGGAAGATSNLPGQPQQANGEIKSDTKRINEVVNYAVPQTIRTTTRPSGSVKKLSVAVVLDGRQSKSTNKDGQVENKSEAWSAEKLKEFEAVVSGAVALDRKRGDTLEVKNMEFTRVDLDTAEDELAAHQRKAYIQNMVVYGVVGILFVLFFLFVVRPFVKWVTENTIDSVDTFLPQTIEELEKLQKNNSLPGLEDAVPVMPDRLDPEKVEGEMMREKITTLVETNPHKAALILRDWLHTEGPKKEKEAGGKGKTA